MLRLLLLFSLTPPPTIRLDADGLEPAAPERADLRRAAIDGPPTDDGSPMEDGQMAEGEQSPLPALTPAQEEETERLRALADSQAHAAEVADDLRARQRRLFAGLLVPSILASGTGLVALAVAREPDGSEPTGPVCTTGKRCGNACIAVEYECEVGNASRTTVTPTGWAVFGVAATLGIGLLVAAIVAPRRLKPRSLACGASGCSFVMRF